MPFPLIPIALGLEALQLGKQALDTAGGLGKSAVNLLDDGDLKD